MCGIVPRPKKDRESYYFVSLETVKMNYARQWIVLHVTESVIGRAEKLATKKRINEMVDGKMLFEWKPEDPILLQHNSEQVITQSNHITNE